MLLGRAFLLLQVHPLSERQLRGLQLLGELVVLLRAVDVGAVFRGGGRFGVNAPVVKPEIDSQASNAAINRTMVGAYFGSCWLLFNIRSSDGSRLMRIFYLSRTE